MSIFRHLQLKSIIKQNGLKNICKCYKSQDICLYAVQQNPWALEDVPYENKTEEICLAAVKQNGWVLEYVPEKIMTKEICDAAVKSHKWAHVIVPDKYKNN